MRATLQSITDSIPALLAYIGKDRRYIVANKAYETWLGISPEKIVGRTIGDVLGPAVLRNLEPYIDRVLAGEAVTFEARLPYSAGMRDVEAKYVPDVRGDGSVLGFVSLVTDVTERKKLEEGLEKERAQAQEASRQYRALAEIIPQLVWTSDATGALNYVNQRWIDFTGLTLEQSRECGWEGVLHQDDFARTRQVWAQSIDSGELYEVTARVRRASDGSSRWFLARAFPLKDDSGRVVSWFGTCTDVHDQKTHEDNERLLSEASRVLASSLELSATLPTVASMLATWFHGYCIVDLLGPGGLERAVAVHMDPAQQPLLDAIHAFSPGEDRDSPLWRVIQSRTPQMCNVITEEMIASSSASAEHQAARRAVGTTGYMIAPLIAGGLVAGTIMIGSTAGDAFEEAHLRSVQELAYRIAIAVGNSRAYADAREANRLKDEFLAVVSHELRTPLNAMRGWTSLLRGSRLDEKQRMRAIEIIDRNINAQTQLVEDLLDVSRIVTGSMRLNIEEVHLAPVVRAALDSIAPAAAAKRIALETELDETSATVRGDAARLQQIVWNLLSNSIKFTPSGGRVSIRMTARDGLIELTVTDTGQGISAEFLPHVFERFRQGDSTTTRRVGGLGIGLAIVRHLAELHGGTVSAFSEGEGRGATFVLTLPAQMAAAEEEPDTRRTSVTRRS